MGFLKWTAIFAIIIALSAVMYQRMNPVDMESYYKNKRVIITGASQGIGKELAIRLSQLGSRLVIAARTESKLKETQKLCQQYSPDVFVVKADVGVEEDTKLIVDEAVEHLGGVDIVILNAAKVPEPAMFTELENPGESFLSVYRVNVLQGVYLTQYSLPYLRKSHGQILAVSSLAGMFCTPKYSAYSVSKSALHAYFGSLDVEFEMRQENVSITIMPLGFIYTEAVMKTLKENYNAIMEPGITPEDCAERMIRGLPLRQLFYYITWDGFVFSHLRCLAPYWFDRFASFFARSYAKGLD